MCRGNRAVGALVRLRRPGGSMGLAFAVLMQWMLGCTCNSDDGEGPAPEVALALESIEGTTLETNSADVLPPLTLDGAGVPEVDVGSGVQVLQIAPVGPDRAALQAAVVFDRPMVALADLDSMSQNAALNCTPEINGRKRWAGTSTAVFLPESGSFPKATAFRCTVQAGTLALDGVALEKELTWTFETPRPRVMELWPYDGADGIDLKQPVRVRFDQPVSIESVKPHVSVFANGTAVGFELRRPSPPGGPSEEAKPDERELEVRFRRVPDTRYTVRVSPGVLGQEGPLPSDATWSTDFATYPPLRVELRRPESTVLASPSGGIQFRFETPVKQEEVSKHVRIEPQPADWAPPSGDWDSTYWGYRPILEPRTTYTVSLGAELTDIYGQKLTGPASWTLTTGDYEPWLLVPHGFKLIAANNPPDLPYKHLNASRVDIGLAPVDPGTLTEPENWRGTVDLALGKGGRNVSGAATKVRNQSTLARASITDMLGPDRVGWIASRFSAPNVVNWEGDPRVYRGLMVVTDLGATMKVGPGTTDVWVTSLAKGTPVEGVDVEVYAGQRRLGSARTGKDGIAQVSGAPTGEWRRWRDELWALLRKGSDESIVRLQWNDGLAPYNFSVWGGFEPTGQRVSSHAYTDRGVYRPGDPVYSRVTFRLKHAKGLGVAAGQVSWTLEDPDGQTVDRGAGSLDDRGGVSIKTTIPAEGGLGDYSLLVEASGQGWAETAYLTARARAYRPPAFRVEMLAPSEGVVGQPIEAVADARYLFGASLSKGEVSWASWTESHQFEPDGWEGWSFGPEYEWWDESSSRDACYRSLLGQIGEPLQNGRSTFSQTVEAEQCEGPMGVYVEASVEDVDRQVISNRSRVVVHPASFYVGAKSTARLPKAGKPVDIEVAAVDVDGKARSGESLDVVVAKRTWDSVRERGMDGQWRWVVTTTDETVHSESVKSAAAAKKVRFTPKEPGYYVFTVQAKDEGGRVAKGTDSVYVVGPGFVSWGQSDDNKLGLVPDKRSYAPGEVARVLVKSPFEGLRALVTVEREGVLWRDVVTLEGTATTLEIPIEETYRPNVFVSVVAVQGAGPQTAPDKGRPQVYMGLVELGVDAEEEHLAVTVLPDASLYRPRDTVNVSLKVERAGEPVAGAGVTLYAVDEAILSLTNYQTPDAHQGMYAHRPLSVLTADGRVAALDRAPFLQKGANRGGGGGEGEDGGPETRSRFLTTITWQPDLKTDVNGVINTTFELPDNLTTFRIMAVADAGAASFGSGDKEIRVSRPLIVRPALPRHLRQGDEAFAGVVVHNGFVRDRLVEVQAEVEGPVELVGAPVVVRVAAKESVEVPFTIRAKAPGEAKFTFNAVAGPDRDGIVWTLPIGREVLLETTATAGTIEAGTTMTEQIARPDGAFEGHGGLSVDVSTTALLGAGTALDYLLKYPHGCIEQRTSRALASLMALQVRKQASIEVPEAELRRNVEGTLQDLAGFRTSEGGFAYWGGGREASPMGTAYAVELMGRAQQLGFKVDQQLLAHAVDYLRSYLSRSLPAHRRLVGLAEQAVIAGALAHAQQGDAGLNQRLYANRRDLSVFATANLLQAIARTTGSDVRTKDLAKRILGRATIEAGSASIKENESGMWARMWGSDDLSTAGALEALLSIDPQHPLAAKFALHLASSRRTGHWTNTRATAGVLSALATYSRLREAPGDAVTATIALPGESALTETVAVPGANFVDVPMVDVNNGLLNVGAKGGLLYYMARLQYAPQQPKPRDEGFTITRAFDLMGAEGERAQVTAGAMVRVTLTVVTPVVRHDVAVIDRIPAGLEPMDASLATTSRAPQAPPEGGQGTDELPEYGGSWVFDHHEISDDSVRLYADYMPPGVHTFRYVARATTPGTFDHPPASVEEMYEPENFGRTGGGTLVVGAKAR